MAHQYWSLNISALISSEAKITLLKLKMFDSLGGVNLCTGGTASATSENEFYPASHAFDDTAPDIDRYWQAGNYDRPQRLIYQFATAVDVTHYQLFASPSDDRPKTWTLDYSDDGTTWTTAATITDFVFSQSIGDMASQLFDLSGAIAESGSTDSAFTFSAALVSESDVTMLIRLTENYDYQYAFSAVLAGEYSINLSSALVSESSLLLSVRPIEITDNAILFSSPLVNIQDSQLSMTAELLQYRLTDSQLTLSVNLEAEYQSLVIDIHNPETPVYGEYL